MMIDESSLRVRFDALRPSLDERRRRLSAAAEAKAAGYGGIAAVARATKVARRTIGRGLKDLRNPGSLTGEERRKGGGTPRLTVKDPTLLEDLQRLLEPATMGDPMRPLRWVSKSHDKLATALRAMGHKVSSSTIPKLLEELKYCRHSNRKTKEAGKHPDRDAQFEYINAKVEAFQAAGEPVISIDAKKKELLGEFKNGGSDYGPQGRTDRGQRSRFRGQGVGQGRPLRGLRHRRQPRLCQPRNRSRHRGVRRQRRPMLARSDGLEALSRDEAPDDHGRRWRLQWFTAAALEVGPPAARGRNRSDHSGLPLSARDFEVEQDRASHVLPHHAELARDATPQPPHRHRTDRQHHDENRSQNPLRTR